MGLRSFSLSGLAQRPSNGRRSGDGIDTHPTSLTMTRSTLLRLAPAVAISLVLSCTTPTGMCGCPPGLTHAVAHGVVRTAAGAPVQGAFVSVAIYPDRCEASTQLAERATRLTQTDAAGAYEARFHSVSGPRQACLRVSATRGQGATADSAASEGALVQLRPENDKPARVRVDVVFPGS